MALSTYQIQTVAALHQYYSAVSQGPGLCVLPLGCDKTTIINVFMQALLAVNPDLHVLVLARDDRAVQTTKDNMLRGWPKSNIGILSEDTNKHEICQITLASSVSFLARIGDLTQLNLVIIDEAHFITPEQLAKYQRILKAPNVVSPNVKVIGFSAMPFGKRDEAYLAGKQLFAQTFFQLSMATLVQQGVLRQIRAVKVEPAGVVNTHKVAVLGGDYIPSKLEEIVAVQPVVESICLDWFDRTAGRLATLFVTTNYRQAQMFQAFLLELGFDIPLISINTSAEIRRTQIHKFQNGELNFIITVGNLTLGGSCSRLACIVLARPSLNLRYFLLAVSQGLSVGEIKSETLLFDYGGNLKRFGPLERVKPLLESEQYLHEKEKISVCPTCDTLNSVYSTKCSYCTERLREDCNLKNCSKCFAGNDSYAEYCDICGETMKRNTNVVELVHTIKDGVSEQRIIKIDMQQAIHPSRGLYAKLLVYTSEHSYEEDSLFFDDQGIPGNRARDFWFLILPFEDTPQTTIEALRVFNENRSFISCPQTIKIDEDSERRTIWAYS